MTKRARRVLSIEALASVAVAVVLVTLVTAAFALPRPAHVAAVAPPPEGARAAPAARGVTRARDEAPIDVRAETFDVLVQIDVAERSDPIALAAEVAPDPTPEPTPTPVPTPRRTATPVPAPVVVTGVRDAELRMLALMNASRAAGGLTPLALDEGVSLTARRHSAVEAQVGYVYHDGPDGTAASRNVPACGTGWYGENTGKVWQGNVDRLHLEFMAEPWIPINHRTNIMDPNFRRVGVGAVQGPDALYMTMVFCR